MEDLGDKYEITVEAPGIPKDKITVKAGTHYIDISGEQEKKMGEKRKNYLFLPNLFLFLQYAYIDPSIPI